ncbi:MAG: hypothetical protein NZ750_02805 [Anaerolineae bacterium]|nr:hypothetical protein [Anaerolineae bacterium]MDW8173391.1 hypothetical protein [Anaerolineae bacterium]
MPFNMPFKWIRIAMFIGLLALLGLALFSARAWQIGDRCLVARGQVIEGGMLALCRELYVEGRIGGDLVALAWRVRIVGTVEGSSYLVAQDKEIRGQRVGWSMNLLALLLGVLAQGGVWWLGRRSAQRILLPVEEPLPPRPAAPNNSEAPLIASAPVPAPEPLAPAPPPRIESHALGMDNLPEGFDPRFFFSD